MIINFEILVVVILYSFENFQRVHNFVKEDNPTHICSLWKSCTFLKRWHRLAVSDRSAICGQLETFSHVFCECMHSPAVWTCIVTILNKLHATPLVFSQARSSAVRLFLVFVCVADWTRGCRVTCEHVRNGPKVGAGSVRHTFTKW